MSGKSSDRDNRMNFILCNPDEMRSDALGCYGNPAGVTPNLDRTAQQSVRFDGCFVQNSVCTPSRCSFMTGLYPHHRGHRTLWNLLESREPHLFSYLKQAGYQIHWCGKNDLLTPQAVMDSIDSINDMKTEDTNRPEHAWRTSPISCDDGRHDFSFLYESDTPSIESHPDYQRVQAACEWLKTRPQKPFCLFLPLGFPHPPYSTTLDFQGVVNQKAIPPLRPLMQAGEPDFHRLIRSYRHLDRLTEKDFRTIRRVYLEQTAMIDHMVGKLMQTLREYGYENNTAFVFFSDHGDWAGDYGLVEKWPSGLDDSLLHVPFIIKAPGCVQGHVVKEPVEMFDMMATVLDLAGIESNHTHFAKSLVPQLQGESGDPNRAVFAEGGYDTHEPHCFEGSALPFDVSLSDKLSIYYPKALMQQEHPKSVCRSVMVRSMTHKLVLRSSDRHEFYDLHHDPQELNNRYKDAALRPIIAEYKERLLKWYLHTGDTVPVQRDARGFASESSSIPREPKGSKLF